MSDTQRELEELRQNIAKLDLQLRDDIEKRARLSRRAGELRGSEASQQLPLLDAMLENIVSKASGDMPAESLRAIFREVIAQCLTLEMPAKVATVGPEGSPSFVAARRRFGAAATAISFETAAAALAEVAGRRA